MAATIAGRLSDRVSLVTGAGRGIGRAIAQRLAAEGAAVVAADLEHARAEETREIVTDAGGSCTAYPVDVADRASVRRLVDAILREHGRLDVLVNNAGIARPVGFLQTSDDDWDAVLGVNLRGAFLVAQEAARQMVERASGAIINVTSLSGHLASAGQAAYAVSKGGLISLTKVIAFELGPLGIRVNAVSPGPVETELARSMLTPATRSAREARIPLGRLGQPEEIASVVAFLVSSDASYVNGHVVLADGGLLIGGIRA